MGSSLKQRQNVLQGSNTNLELNTWPLAKWVSLKTFRNIPFLHFRYVQRIVNYSVLTPKINLTKLTYKWTAFIIFITFLSGEFNTYVAIIMTIWDIATRNQGGRGLANFVGTMNSLQGWTSFFDAFFLPVLSFVE